MPFTLDDVLNDPLLTVVERHDEMGSFAVRVGTLTTLISIELGRFKTDDRTKFWVSHVMHTPRQAGPYRTSISYADYWAYGLHRAVSGLTTYYKEAVKAGDVPSEAWLVPV